jgi:hypothetical protein
LCLQDRDTDPTGHGSRGARSQVGTAARREDADAGAASLQIQVAADSGGAPNCDVMLDWPPTHPRGTTFMIRRTPRAAPDPRWWLAITRAIVLTTAVWMYE